MEPFAGSLAVLLARPNEWTPRVETVNDKDAYLANFWRALAHDPDAVAAAADWPVNEADLHARHRWLVETARERVEKLTTDAEFYDPLVAGWWVWGQCLWIGSGWCAAPGWDGRHDTRNGDTSKQARRPHLSSDQGTVAADRRGPTHANTHNQARRPELHNAKGVHAHGKRPVLRDEHDGPAGVHHKRFAGTGNGQGTGVHRVTLVKHANGTDAERIVDWNPRPDLSSSNGRGGVFAHGKKPQFDRGGRGITGPSIYGNGRFQGGGRGGGSGVHRPMLHGQLPQLSGDGSGAQRGYLATGIEQSGGLYTYMRELAARLRRVRVCCGDWTRVLTPAVTTYIGVTGVLLDPPYEQSQRTICYSHDENISAGVRAWALEHGDDPKMRIALCGYEGEHEMPASWECVPWKAHGGYSRSKRGKANRARERIWFSPHCLRPSDSLFHAPAAEVTVG